MGVDLFQEASKSFCVWNVVEPWTQKRMLIDHHIAISTWDFLGLEGPRRFWNGTQLWCSWGVGINLEQQCSRDFFRKQRLLREAESWVNIKDLGDHTIQLLGYPILTHTHKIYWWVKPSVNGPFSMAMSNYQGLVGIEVQFIGLCYSIDAVTQPKVNNWTKFNSWWLYQPMYVEGNFQHMPASCAPE